uniref:hypothetical protein n=1 Tax=Inonotus hispidus TaxID=40469 RepID=UPI0021825158|nr:hypothetical protein N4M07_mgp071 [Inonotus hispidus]UVF37981.1 hypothetical protein [Inonotus hispidus]
MVKALNVNSLTKNRNVKNISRLSTKTSSTLFTQKPYLNKINRKSKLTNLNYYGFCSMLPCFSINGIFVINGIRAFHNSAILNFKTPNFIKNLFSKNNGPSISAPTSTSTTSSTSDRDSETEFKSINLWINFVGLFSDKLADRMAYNRINKKRVSEWRSNVAEAQENNQSNSNNNSNSNINNINNNNSNIISTNTNNVNNLNNNSNNSNNNNNNNVNSHNDYSSDSDDSGGDFGE